MGLHVQTSPGHYLAPVPLGLSLKLQWPHLQMQTLIQQKFLCCVSIITEGIDGGDNQPGFEPRLHSFLSV